MHICVCWYHHCTESQYVWEYSIQSCLTINIKLVIWRSMNACRLQYQGTTHNFTACVYTSSQTTWRSAAILCYGIIQRHRDNKLQWFHYKPFQCRFHPYKTFLFQPVQYYSRCSGIRYHVVWWIGINVSEGTNASIFRVEANGCTRYETTWPQSLIPHNMIVLILNAVRG
jgi:hypothetical protein